MPVLTGLYYEIDLAVEKIFPIKLILSWQKFLAPDAFVFFQIRGRKILLMSDLELDRAKDQADVDEVVSISKYSEQIKKKLGKSPTMIEMITHFLHEKKVKLWHMEGMDIAQWVLLDFSDVIVHIFYAPVREFYNLERLWGDADQV